MFAVGLVLFVLFACLCLSFGAWLFSMFAQLFAIVGQGVLIGVAVVILVKLMF